MKLKEFLTVVWINAFLISVIRIWELTKERDAAVGQMRHMFIKYVIDPGQVLTTLDSSYQHDIDIYYYILIGLFIVGSIYLIRSLNPVEE